MLKINGFDVAVIFAADMMNVVDKDQEFSTLDLWPGDEPGTRHRKVHQKADFAVLYAHTGLLFCPYPSVKIRERQTLYQWQGFVHILTGT